MRPRRLLRPYKKEKDSQVREQMWLNILVEWDGMCATGAAVHMECAPSWGVKWRRRYLDDRKRGLRTRPKPGRPSRIFGEAMDAIRQKVDESPCWTAEDLFDLIKEESGGEYDVSYVRRLLRGWWYTRKVSVGRYVNRANRWKIAWFRRKVRHLIRERLGQGYVVSVQEESIVVTDVRPRKGVYAKMDRRAAYTYTGSHSKTVAFGVIRRRETAACRRRRSRTPLPVPKYTGTLLCCRVAECRLDSSDMTSSNTSILCRSVSLLGSQPDSLLLHRWRSRLSSLSFCFKVFF